jgi:hypothetical protein
LAIQASTRSNEDVGDHASVSVGGESASCEGLGELGEEVLALDRGGTVGGYGEVEVDVGRHVVLIFTSEITTHSDWPLRRGRP